MPQKKPPNRIAKKRYLRMCDEDWQPIQEHADNCGMPAGMMARNILIDWRHSDAGKEARLRAESA